MHRSEQCGPKLNYIIIYFVLKSHKLKGILFQWDYMELQKLCIGSLCSAILGTSLNISNCWSGGKLKTGSQKICFRCRSNINSLLALKA